MLSHERRLSGLEAAPVPAATNLLLRRQTLQQHTRQSVAWCGTMEDALRRSRWWPSACAHVYMQHTGCAPEGGGALSDGVLKELDSGGGGEGVWGDGEGGL